MNFCTVSSLPAYHVEMDFFPSLSTDSSTHYVIANKLRNNALSPFVQKTWNCHLHMKTSGNICSRFIHCHNILARKASKSLIFGYFTGSGFVNPASGTDLSKFVQQST